MTEDASWRVRLVGANLAFIVAGIHLLMGLRYWTLYARGGNYIPPDPRISLWTISALAIFAGMVALYLGAPKRPIYGLGIGVMVAYVVGYFSWHLGGHGKFYLGGTPDLHGVSLSTYLLDHLFAGPIETVSIVLEVALLVLLVALLFTDE
jgi:hypothetical protein